MIVGSWLCGFRTAEIAHAAVLAQHQRMDAAIQFSAWAAGAAEGSVRSQQFWSLDTSPCNAPTPARVMGLMFH